MRKSIIFSRKLCLGPATFRTRAMKSPKLFELKPDQPEFVTLRDEISRLNTPQKP